MLLTGGLLKSKTNPKPNCNLKHIWSKLFYVTEDLHFEHGRISSYGSRISEDVVLQVPKTNISQLFQILQSPLICAWLCGHPGQVMGMAHGSPACQSHDMMLLHLEAETRASQWTLQPFLLRSPLLYDQTSGRAKIVHKVPWFATYIRVILWICFIWHLCKVQCALNDFRLQHWWVVFC